VPGEGVFYCNGRLRPTIVSPIVKNGDWGAVVAAREVKSRALQKGTEEIAAGLISIFLGFLAAITSVPTDHQVRVAESGAVNMDFRAAIAWTDREHPYSRVVLAVIQR
jgi:hypothetical protein